MINGFEEYTVKLSKEEREVILPIIVKALQKKVGKVNMISNRQMRAGLKANKGISISAPRMRKIVNFIRNNFLIEGLVATSKGYWVSRDPAELHKYIESLEQHEASIRNTKKNVQLYLHKLLNNAQTQ